MSWYICREYILQSSHILFVGFVGLLTLGGWHFSPSHPCSTCWTFGQRSLHTWSSWLVHLRHCERRLTAFNMTTRHQNWRFARLLLCRILCKMPGRINEHGSLPDATFAFMASWYLSGTSKQLGSYASCLNTTHVCLNASVACVTCLGPSIVSNIWRREV